MYNDCFFKVGLVFNLVVTSCFFTKKHQQATIVEAHVRVYDLKNTITNNHYSTLQEAKETQNNTHCCLNLL
jgi:hypothetical protein